MIGREGCSPDPKKVDAIANMSPPGDVTSLRSFLGLCNTFSNWLPDLSQTAKPLRELLKKGRAYTWLDIHQEAFDKLKEFLTSDLCLSPFDPLKKTYLISDASKGSLHRKKSSFFMEIFHKGSDPPPLFSGVMEPVLHICENLFFGAF